MPDDARSAPEWIAAFAAVSASSHPTADLVDTLLELAGVAAHSSERTAAPIACWLVGRRRALPRRGPRPRSAALGRH